MKEYTKIAEVPEDQWYDQIQVNFGELTKLISEIVGWIHFENEDIDYPILYSGDNDKYLRKTYDGNDATAGSIFLDGTIDLIFRMRICLYMAII